MGDEKKTNPAWPAACTQFIPLVLSEEKESGKPALPVSLEQPEQRKSSAKETVSEQKIPVKPESESNNRLSGHALSAVSSSRAKKQLSLSPWFPMLYVCLYRHFHDMLRRAGVSVFLTDSESEHFAVIDKKLVWHGGMNLLGKEDVWDNLIRIESVKAAAELLEMTKTLME